jgi:hypothetical protein
MSKHRTHFPRTISRFTALEGGQYGTATLLAITPETLEVQLGGDFVQFSRRQAEELRNAVGRFLELDDDDRDSERPKHHSDRPSHHRHDSDDRVEVATKMEEKVEVVEEVRERGARRKRA